MREPARGSTEGESLEPEVIGDGQNVAGPRDADGAGRVRRTAARASLAQGD